MALAQSSSCTIVLFSPQLSLITFKKSTIMHYAVMDLHCADQLHACSRRIFFCLSRLLTNTIQSTVHKITTPQYYLTL